MPNLSSKNKVLVSGFITINPATLFIDMLPTLTAVGTALPFGVSVPSNGSLELPLCIMSNALINPCSEVVSFAR